MKTLDNIKIVGVDLDGTLLTDDKKLCKGAEEIINSVYKKGIYFVPITGRPFGGVPDCIKNLDAVKYIIASNGSQIIDAKNGVSIYCSQLNNSTVSEILSVLNDFDCMYEAFFDNFGHIEQKTYDYYVNVYSSTPIGDYIFSSRRVVPSITDLFVGTDKCADEIFVICKSREQRDCINKALSKIPTIQLCLLGDRFLEATKKGTDKGSALQWICDYLDIDISSALAFGDGENDVQFLEKAGVSVAMENAFDNIKQISDITTLSNNDNGVCHILKKIVKIS